MLRVRASVLLRVAVVFAAATLSCALCPGSAGAATFRNESPAMTDVLEASGMRTISVDVVAAPGQTLSLVASLSVDGGAAVPVIASYFIIGYEPWFDGEYGVWVDVPVYDYSRAKYSSAQFLSTGVHRFSFTVMEQPSGVLSTYSWWISSDNCTVCHDDQPLAHDTSDCALCHTPSGPVLKHNAGGFGGCTSCHGGAHPADRLDDHLYFDLDGNPSFREARICTSCHTSEFPAIPQIDGVHPGGPYLNRDAQNRAVRGYLTWDDAESYPGNEYSSSPHGGYAASTNKCAVCHSVHQAKVAGSVLTAFGPYETYAQGCIACHGVGATFTSVHITADADGHISPHGTCTRCHALGPHGIGTSEYAVLAARLLGPRADAAIGADLAAGANGLSSDLFETSSTPAAQAQGLTLGTGYLCSACHQQSFAVNSAGVDPAGGGAFSGHRVTATATADWDQDAFGGSLAASLTVSYADADRCSSCHDAQAAFGGPAFPHGYVDTYGAVAPATVSGSSYVWLTTAESALDTRTIVGKVVPEAGETNADLLTNDGLCLKCHRNGAGSGVGQTF